MRFTKGFTYMGKPYGWYKKKLYRLPYKLKTINRWYGLLECAKWEGKGFILGNHRKSYAQLKEMTTDIDVEVDENDDDFLPF
jgi:hypothetical protein